MGRRFSSSKAFSGKFCCHRIVETFSKPHYIVQQSDLLTPRRFRRVEHFRQSIRIVGPENSAHAVNLQALAALVTFMNVSLPRGAERPQIKTHGQPSMPDIQLSSRLFTKSCDVSEEDQLTPSSLVDPHGVMQDVISRGQYCYGPDNIVDFDAVTVGKDG